MELFKIGGFCPETNYVFMGEFGCVSVMLGFYCGQTWMDFI